MHTDTNRKTPLYTAKDFDTNQDVRWCPGCGDYAILKQVKSVLPTLGVKREDIVFISGIGCSSRFPYYVNTYGMHSIHGRATSIATGLKVTRPELSVWVVTGDGDCLSIGGNHFIHLLRRNVNINVLLFNNKIYGLTKGQYSPTSEREKVTKSSPLGTIDEPFNVPLLALGAKATFIARSIDTESAHLRSMLQRTHTHAGTSFLEIYQNCNIFNDGAFQSHKDKVHKHDYTLQLEHGQPLVFGSEQQYGMMLDGARPYAVLTDRCSRGDLWIHDEKDTYKAYALARMPELYDATLGHFLPTPIGVLYIDTRPSYEDVLYAKNGPPSEASMTDKDLNQFIRGSQTWQVV